MENGKVTLVAKTVPVIEELKESEELLAYIARVSNPKNQLNKATAEKLIRYLIEHSHWSPLQMVGLVVEVTTTRDISRQLLRHDFDFQEFSQRYAEVQDDQFVLREARLQDPTNRQNSIENKNLELQIHWDMHQEEVLQHAKIVYNWAIKNGIAKEQARVVLPEGMTLTRLYVSGTLRNWYHYCKLRMGNGTQKEHQDIARNVWGVIVSQFPSFFNL